jgi:hypothetical protein
MRMSLSRLAALGAALLAGVTLAACASSSAPIAPTGFNSQITSFVGAPVKFVQGSPNLHLGITAADFCLDGNFVATLPYRAATPYITSVPAGPHFLVLYTPSGGAVHCNSAPLFTGSVITLANNTKTLIVVAGDAGAVPTGMRPQILTFAAPHYNTPTGQTTFTIYNASPRNSPLSHFEYCIRATSICDAGHTDLTGALALGKSKTAALLPSTGNVYCFGAYHTGTTLIIDSGFPVSTDDPAGTGCSATSPLVLSITAPANNVELVLVDDLFNIFGSLEIPYLSEQNG